MAYTLTFDIVLGAGRTGLTLEAQIVDITGASVGGATGGFVEIGDGNYMVTLTTIPDNHRGGIKIQLSGGGALQAFASINPEEAELIKDIPSDVNAEVVDVLTADTISELAVAAPAATPTVFTALMWLYMRSRNKRETTSSVDRVKNDAGTTIATAALTDVAGTFTKDEYV